MIFLWRTIGRTYGSLAIWERPDDLEWLYECIDNYPDTIYFYAELVME